MWFSKRLYIRISRERITLSTSDRWAAFDEPPLVAVRYEAGTASIAAFGGEAATYDSRQNVRVLNPFAHPRSIVSDFTIAEKLIEHAVDTVLPRRWLRPRIAAVIHPLGEFEGGLTQVEYRALRELCFVSGAHAMAVHEGHELTAAELAAFDFTASDTPAL